MTHLELSDRHLLPFIQVSCIGMAPARLPVVVSVYLSWSISPRCHALNVEDHVGVGYACDRGKDQKRLHQRNKL